MICILQQLNAILLPFPPSLAMMLQQLLLTAQEKRSSVTEAHFSYSLAGFALQQYGELHFSTSLTLCNLADFVQMG